MVSEIRDTDSAGFLNTWHMDHGTCSDPIPDHGDEEHTKIPVNV
jgi:hypothetical protein